MGLRYAMVIEECIRFNRCQTIGVLTVAVVLTVCPGCGDGRIPIQGEITFHGQPVEAGTISLEPADGKGPTTGGPIVAGKYELTGAAAPLPGKKIVRVIGIRKTGRKVRDAFSATGAMLEETQPYIPDLYNTRSTLSCDVVGRETNRFDFQLK
jgi:hypothetical protein